MAVVGFLHTSAVHIATFDRLVAEMAPGTTSHATVDEALLTLAREIGPRSTEVRERVTARIEQLAAAGADTIVCTCSTIGGVAETVGAERGRRVVRVDRAMAERAVATGGRVLVVAALASTLGPTRDLLESVAAAQEREVAIEVRLIEGAWARFEAGDDEGYLAAIAAALPTIAATCDVVVLAQASMAAAADRVDLGVPVLSSPRLAVAALVD